MSYTPQIFLDSGDPEESRKAKSLLGQLDGQTTNPTLVIRHPQVQKYLKKGKKLTKKELLAFYKDVVGEIATVTNGPISVEVYADWDTTTAEMLTQAEKMYTWGKNIYMKFPTIPAGVAAAQQFVSKGGKVNMTLVFTQEQAAAVYSATLSTKEPAFLSPFMGRWDDRGFSGISFLKNVIEMYHAFDTKRKAPPHVKVLAASIRTMQHLHTSLFLKAAIVTMPLKLIDQWVAEGKTIPENAAVLTSTLTPIPYTHLSFTPEYTHYQTARVKGDLLDEGLERFAKDWNSLLV